MRGNNVPISDPIILEKALPHRISDLPHRTSASLIVHSLRNEVDETIETLNRLSLFTEDSGFDHLISNYDPHYQSGKKI